MPLVQSLIRRTKNTFHGGLKEKIFFLHVPKCGGTSISDAISCHYQTLNLMAGSCLVSLSPDASSNVVSMLDHTDYPYDTTDDYPILKVRETLLLYFMNLRNTKYISGHFTFNETAYRQFHHKYAFVTILRDPVKRWISSYFFNRYKQADHRKIEEDIRTHLQSEFGQSQGYEYTKFLGGADQAGDYISRQTIDRAKRNLHKFDILGLLEYPEAFFKQFEDRFGIRLKLERRNQGPASESHRKSVITNEIQKEIKAICKPDLEIYQYAVDNFVKANH